MLTHITITSPLCYNYYHYPHFTKKQTEGMQRLLLSQTWDLITGSLAPELMLLGIEKSALPRK